MASSRRDLLRFFLGAPVAAACRDGRRAAGGVDAAFVDPPLTLAHRLRAPVPSPEGLPAQRVKVLVLGAGVSGLTAAWRLRQGGLHDLAVLELEDGPGGTARGGRGPSGPFPWGAHYLPAPRAEQPELVALLDEMGLVTDRGPGGEPNYAEAARVASPRERIFAAGLWQPGLLPELGRAPGQAEAVAAFARRMRALAAARGEDGRRAFALPTAASSEDPAFADLDRMSFSAWLDREGFDHPAVRWLADYATRDDFGCTPQEASAWFGLHYHAARMDPRTGRSAPFLTWPEGNQRLVDHLVARVGRDRLGLGRLVTRVRPHPSGRGIEVFAHTERSAERWLADRVVWALPSFLGPRLLPSPPPVRETSAWLVANLHLSRRPRGRGAEVAWDNVLMDSRSLGYVVATHQRGPRAGPTTWTWYLPMVDRRPVEARHALLALGAEDAAELALSDLERAHPDLRRCVQRVELRRFGHAMPIPAPGGRRPRPAPTDGIHFAHTDRSGVALFEEAFHNGLSAADAILRSPPG